jgi:hypothetical protein
MGIAEAQKTPNLSPLIGGQKLSTFLPLVDKWTHQAQIRVEIETPLDKRTPPERM